MLHKGDFYSKKALKPLHIKDLKAFRLARCKGFEPLTFWFVVDKITFHGVSRNHTKPYISTVSSILPFTVLHKIPLDFIKINTK